MWPRDPGVSVMRIDALQPLPGVGETSLAVSLEQRIGAPHRPDPVQDGFYAALQNWQASGASSVHEFLKAYALANGEQPYRSNGSQMEILQVVLKRLKDEGLGDSLLYQETYGAFATVFSTKAFITQFAQEVFDPQAVADQEEESSW